MVRFDRVSQYLLGKKARSGWCGNTAVSLFVKTIFHFYIIYFLQCFLMIIVTCFQYDFQTANENNSLVCMLNKGWLTILELIRLAMADAFFVLSLECLKLRGF